MKRFCLLLCLVGLLFSSVVPTAVLAAGLERGQELYQLGRPDQALAVLRDYVRTAPPNTETARAYALIGRILTEQKNYSEVILYLQRTPDVLRSPDIELLHGHALVASEHFRAGLEMLQPLLNEPLPPDDQRLLFQALTTAAIAEEQLLLGLYYLQQQFLLAQQPEAVLDQAHQLLQNRMSETDLEEAAFMWQGTAIGQDARLQLARHALARQQPERAQEQLQILLAAGIDFPYRQEAQVLLERSHVDDWLNRNSIGVLLPLSGPYASYGERVQQVFELALAEHNRNRFPLRFVYRDTAAAVPVRNLVSDLANEERVIAILGPLLSSHATEAAAEAQRLMVPLLTLAQAEGLPQIGNFIFRDTVTAQQQVNALADYAIANDRISVSILHPATRHGEQMARLFSTALQRRGGDIIDIVSYPEGTTDFRAQVQQLLWTDQTRPIPEGKTGGLPEPEYPLPPFDALFIPDFADNIGLIAPQLVFYGIKDVTLLGIDGWNSPELLSRAGRFLSRAVFIDAFYAAGKRPEVRSFVDLYRQEFQEEPSILEAQAFAVTSLLLKAVDRPEVTNREGLRLHLLALDHVRGITGTQGFDIEGEAIKKLTLLGFQRGRLVELND
jgi:ABC-type branched-subunit amino acid transport system substrate-binding protein